MIINLLLVPFVIIFGLLMMSTDSNKNRLRYIIVTCAVLLFIAAMRSPEWMTNTYRIDTLNYKGYFESARDMSWSNFWLAAYSRYLGNNEEADLGFMALNKIVGLYTQEFAFFSLVADLLFFIPFGIIIYRFGTNKYQIIFAFIFYIALVQIFLFAGARQVYALGFDLMAFLAMSNRKKVLTILFLLLGIFMHFSAILFIIPVLLMWFGISPAMIKRIHIICFLLFPFVFFMPNEIIVFMGDSIGMERYSEYGKGAIQGGAETFLILIEILSLFCLFAIKVKDMRNDAKIWLFYIMTPLFTFFAPLIRSNGSMIRISLYFHLFLILLVPYALECVFKGSSRQNAYIFAIGALAILTLSGGGMIYYFYWQV